MPKQLSTVILAEPEYAPGKTVLIRLDLLNPDNPDRQFIWCGRSLGWLPFKTTSNAFFCFFSSDDEAQEAADKYVSLPVQEECPDAYRIA